MRRRLLLSAIVAIACLLVASATFGQVPERESGTITGLRVMPDGKRIVIQSEGQVGRHSAFVIKNPFRLVVDFESTALAKVPGRIKGQGDRIREIRLGYANSRTRLVVDFGDLPVPAFKIDRAGDRILVALGNGMPSSNVRVKPKAPQQPPNRANIQEKRVGPTSSAARDSGLMVKSSGVKDKLVFIELTDRKDPKRSYRLVIDLDASAMVVKNATISDERGNVKRFEPATKDSQAERPSAQGTAAIRGPRKQVLDAALEKDGKPKYKWGMPAVEQKGPQAARAVEPGPFKLEKYRLEARKSGREG